MKRGQKREKRLSNLHVYIHNYKEKETERGLWWWWVLTLVRIEKMQCYAYAWRIQIIPLSSIGFQDHFNDSCPNMEYYFILFIL